MIKATGSRFVGLQMTASTSGAVTRHHARTMPTIESVQIVQTGAAEEPGVVDELALPIAVEAFCCFEADGIVVDSSDVSKE